VKNEKMKKGSICNDSFDGMQDLCCKAEISLRVDTHKTTTA